MEAVVTPERPRVPLAWRWVLLAWLVPAVISTLQQFAAYAARGALEKEWPYAALQFPRMMAWALVTPAIFAAQHRFPLQRRGLGRAVAAHLALSALLSVGMELAWIPITIQLSAWLNPGPQEAIPWLMVSVGLLARVVPGALTYAAVLGVASTLESREALRRREAAQQQLQGQLAAAQLHALKMQVQPHFLFNTLHAITVLIARDAPAATRMVARLGDLLRLTLSRAQRQEVTLADEVELVRHYLEIERVRFADRLTVEWELPPETLDAAVPDLFLQPLVENAIKHGIATSAERGTITLRSRREGEWLVLEVTNTGREATATTAREGLGLAITHGRLEALYPGRHEFSLTRTPAGGAVARVRLPWHVATRGPDA